ncbi:MAG: hypothetical protein K0S47_2755 [Herbinix sp.]|jgi:hypothetical protein|nr:hypothetical protein [Herbinix sp.]
MDYSGMPSQGMTTNGNTLRVNNALIEEVYTDNQLTGYILISYGVEDQDNMIYNDLLRLNVGMDTIIVNQNGNEICLCELTKGTRIAAEFSSAMTRSIPPQARAFLIISLEDEINVSITTDRVVSVDVTNGFLTTGNPYDMYDQMIFTISDATIILDQIGNQIPLLAISPGQLVKVEHAIFQTMSIPPQSPAYRVQILY